MNNRNYTDREISLMRTCYSTQGAEWVARELGRTAHAVRSKASRLGLAAYAGRRPKQEQPLPPSVEQLRKEVTADAQLREEAAQKTAQKTARKAAPEAALGKSCRRKHGRPRKQGQPEVREVERTPDPARYIKTDNLSNYDPEGVRRAQQAEAAASAGKVMLRIDERTHILVPRHLATPQYAEQVRRRWNSHHTSRQE